MYIRGGHSRNIWWNLQHCRFPPERQLAEKYKYHYYSKAALSWAKKKFISIYVVFGPTQRGPTIVKRKRWVVWRSHTHFREGMATPDYNIIRVGDFIFTSTTAVNTHTHACINWNGTEHFCEGGITTVRS